MEMWFSDEHTDNVKLSIRVDKQLFSAQSEFQRIDVLESKEFGKILVADGDLMLTEKDEFIYHEMMAHVPMAVHPKVENVLVIGGGDGGCVRELAKYNTIQKIDVVEVDPLLVEVCRKYFPQIASSLDDDRVTIYNEDGLRFVRSRSNVYDLILIDSPNPFGPAEGLFTKEFYGNCYNALHEDGIMINQHESPFYTEEAFQCQRMHKRIIESFPISKIFRPIRQDTGCSDLRLRNTIRSMTWMEFPGICGGFIQNIICRECTTESLHYRRMWRSL